MSVKKVLFFIGVLLVVGVLYYGISPLFRNIEVNDSIPSEMIKENGGVELENEEVTNTLLETKFGENLATIVDTTIHPASGSVRVLYGEGGKRILRYENYKTINGPDLYVYLATDTSAKDFINLGRIRGTEGNINYEIPEGVDLSKYKYVLTWCRAFGVLFNHAELK